MSESDDFKKVVQNVFDQIGTILVQYLPLPTIISLFETQLFKQLHSDLTRRARLAIYCNPLDIELRLQSFTDCIQNTFSIVPIHDVKIWNIHIRHQLQNKQESIPNISNLIDIQQLLIYLCFISFTKQSKHLIPLCVDHEDVINELPLVIDININHHLRKIKTFMTKIGNTFQHLTEEEDISETGDLIDDIVCFVDV